MKSLFFSIAIILLGIVSLSAQCTQDIRIDFVSIDYKAGCDYNDSNGLDPKLDIFLPGGALLYTSHYGDQSQVTGPRDGEPIDDTVSDNECGNFDVGFDIRNLPSTTTTFDIAVDIYEKDSNIINDQCSGFTQFLDDNLSRGVHTFDLTQSTGKIDVGGCMAYNYVITKQFTGGITIDENRTLCPGDTLVINGTAYHQNNATDNIIIPSNPDACDTTIIVALNFFQDAPLEIMSQDTLCPDGTQTIATSSEYDTYNWSTGATTRDITIDASGSYSVTVTSSNGCQQISAVEIDEVIIMAPQIIGDSLFCEGSNTILEVNTTENILWNTGSSDDNISVTIPGEYGVTVTDDFGCTSSNTINVSESSRPIIELDNALEFCPGDSLILGTVGQFVQHEWSSGNTSETDTISEAGAYSLTVTDDVGCSNTLSFTVTEFARPAPEFNPGPIICNDNPVTLSLSETFATYLWSDSSTESTLAITEGGSYSVTVTDDNGCEGIQSIIVDETVRLTSEIEGMAEICEGDNTVLEETTPGVTHLWADGSTSSTFDATSAGIYAVTITDNNGCTASSSFEVTAFPRIISNFTLITCDPTDVGTIEMEIPNGTSCPDIEIITTELGQNEDCSLRSVIEVESTTCPQVSDGSARISVNGPIDLIPFNLIIFGVGNTLDSLVTSLPFDHTFEGLDIGSYQLLVTSFFAPILMDSFEIESNIIEPEMLDDLSATQGEEIILESPFDTLEYNPIFWSSANGMLCESSCPQVTVNLDSTTTFTLTRTAIDSGCEFTSIQRIIVQPDSEIFIPTIFNPNLTSDDGTFRPLGPGSQLLQSMEIYDRWGNVVFTTDDATIGWNGRINNREAASGVYVYRVLLEIDGEEIVRIGTVTVMR